MFSKAFISDIREHCCVIIGKEFIISSCSPKLLEAYVKAANMAKSVFLEVKNNRNEGTDIAHLFIVTRRTVSALTSSSDGSCKLL